MTKPTSKALRSLQSMDIRGGHFHPGEVGWRRLEAERGVENGIRAIFCLHWIIFSLVDVLVKVVMTEEQC